MIFALGNLFLLPLKTPGALKKVGVIPDILTEFITKFSWLIVSVGILLIILFSIKIYWFYNQYRSRKIKILFRKLYSEILLLNNSSVLNNTKTVEIKNSLKETIDKLIPSVNKRFFSRKIGKDGYQVILVGLDLIKKNKLKVEDQLKLVDNWIQIVRIS